MKKSIHHIFFLCATLILIVGCSSSGDGDGDDDGGNTGGVPEAAELVFPIKDAECNEGVIISNDQSTVPFQWNASKNTNSYTVSLTNLDNDNRETFNTSGNQTELEITIQRGVPYSWKVFSRSNSSSEIAESETWNFFNAGPGVQNYAPFPAALIAPQMGLTVSSSSVALDWEGADADNDIESYDVYFGTANPPSEILQNTVATRIDNVAVATTTTYYWMVSTKDQHGNTTNSSVFEFRTE